MGMKWTGLVALLVRSPVRVWLVSWVVVAGGCYDIEEKSVISNDTVDASAAINDPDEEVPDNGFADTERAEPIKTLEIGLGTEVKFYAWKDLSAGYLVAEAEGVSMLDTTSFEGLSVAEVFRAFSDEGEEVPVELLEHHQALVADGTRPEWAEVVASSERGWYKQTMSGTARLVECNNSTFSNNHCQLTGGYVGQTCLFDKNWGWNNAIGWVNRYKAGFCIDKGGSFSDQLQFRVCGQSSNTTIWASNAWQSPTYLSWEWIAPYSVRRAWYHNSFSGSSLRDFGSKWGQTYGSCGG